MITLRTIGEQIARRRKKLKLSQSQLAKNTSISRATLDALENGRTGELGFSRLTRILTALQWELKLHDIRPQRPTLEDLQNEESHD